MGREQWRERAKQVLDGISMHFDFPMSRLTTFKIGGPLDLLLEPVDLEQVQKSLSFCQEEELPWMVVGLGSNLLVRDKGIRGVGIKLSGSLAEWSVNGTEVLSGAGVTLSDLAKSTACSGLSGLEFACGIPGSVGGAVFMNAGAYDGEMSNVIRKVLAYDTEQGLIWHGDSDLNFGYRFSRFQQEPTRLILKASLQLKTASRDQAEARVAELTCKRSSSQPLEMPSAGSVFRRPEGYFVGPLITEAGLKGYSIGGAQVSTKHAGFIVNTGNATAADVLGLIAHIQKTVKDQSGVDLIPEYRVIGEE